jgi:ankyrin repeat protein
LVDSPHVDKLRHTAKRWLHAIRAKDPEAIGRFRAAYPDGPPIPGLRAVQHALARERGHENWLSLRAAAEQRDARERATAASIEPSSERVSWFIHNACPDHSVRGAPAHVRAIHTAGRLLERYPEIARDSFYTAIVCGDREAVERVLVERPEAVNQKGGPKGWEPLLYLCFTRLFLPAVSENAVAIARALLDRGADPRVYFMAGDSKYTPFVGIVGEGEEDRPGHPHRDELARLLLERGAEPFDMQVNYNIGFHGDVRWFLELAYEQSVRAGRGALWDDPEWSMLDMGGYGSGARWLFNIAVRKNDLALATWMLEHGANPNAAPPRAPRLSKRSLYEEAVREGLTDMADLLVRFGATPTPIALEGEEAFRAACFRLDRAEAQALVASRPEYLRSTKTIFAAAERDRADVVGLLLDLGTSPDVEDERKQRPLHVAAYRNSIRVAELLLGRGAATDAVELNWDNTPLGAAVYCQHPAMIELLGRVSRDIWELVYVGNLERVREVLRQDPDRATVVNDSNTPLMWLPDDERKAMAIVELLLANGADPAIRNISNQTAADIAEKRGMFEIANRLRAAVSSMPGSRALRPAPPSEPRDWDAIIAAMKEQQVTNLDAGGEMTDALLERISRLDHLTSLNLNGSNQLTDAGLASLAHLPRLEHLNLEWCRQITDSGVEALRDCEHLERVGLMGTRTGDGAIRSLAGKGTLRDFRSGEEVTDAGLEWLHQFPAFKTWQGGDESMALLRFDANPTYLLLRGTFTDRGLAALVGLDGLFALNVDFAGSALSASGLAPLADLAHLGWLGFDASDEAMPYIAALPHLRFLMCQDTSAGDDGFEALSRSPTIEYIWGRRCYNLMGRGFRALATMPALRALSVSCKNVDDEALSALPAFPRLTELMPMDVPDAGYRHVGRCQQLESLVLMYCRETTDVATGHIAGLSRLKKYFASYTQITDRSLDILGGMSSLEQITLTGCAGVTDAGVKRLASLPKLRDVDLSGMPNVTEQSLAMFPPHVRVKHSLT